MRSTILLLLLVSPMLAFAKSVARPAKLGQCTACHGDDGRGRVAGTPHLAGQDATYLANALRAFRNGTRRSSPMNSIANTLQPSDIAALAAWYSAQSPTKVAR